MDSWVEQQHRESIAQREELRKKDNARPHNILPQENPEERNIRDQAIRQTLLKLCIQKLGGTTVFTKEEFEAAMDDERPCKFYLHPSPDGAQFALTAVYG